MPTDQPPILAVRGLSKHFGGVTALDNVGFELRRGEVLALAGDNGAGKSTLIKAISGVHQPDEGEIVYRGERVTLRNPRHAREIGIETHVHDLSGLQRPIVLYVTFCLCKQQMRIQRISIINHSMSCEMNVCVF